MLPARQYCSLPADDAGDLVLLKTDGALVNVGAPPQPLPVPAMELILQRRTFAGWQRVLASDVRSRFVIDNATLTEGR